jgi:hypothetical protein
MQRILNDEIEKTIDLQKLQQLVPVYCKVVKYDQLKGDTLAAVMGKYKCLIILWNIHTKRHRTLNKAGHFFVLSTKGPENCVCFSSTGMSPRKELFISNSDPELFDRILPKDTVFNSRRLQINGSSNTCWRWCLCYVHFAEMGLKTFVKLFGRPSLHISNPDTLVTAMTLMTLW